MAFVMLSWLKQACLSIQGSQTAALPQCVAHAFPSGTAACQAVSAWAGRLSSLQGHSVQGASTPVPILPVAALLTIQCPLRMFPCMAGLPTAGLLSLHPAQPRHLVRFRHLCGR